MKPIPRNIPLNVAVQRIKKQALAGLFHGTDSVYDQIFLLESRWWLESHECVVVLTRDTEYHTSGWFKNPDYERCWHLSLSFPGGRTQKAVNELLKAFFGEHINKLWVEPPMSREGKAADCWHFRLFCDQYWNPIKPRKEVYSKDFTKKGWKSYSEVKDQVHKNKIE